MHPRVRMVTHRVENGIYYQVFRGEALVWNRFVKFGQMPAHRAGGQAFKLAARDQEKAAQSLR